MFKLESYITPLLLSYVDKYIKNFRAEDSQVSLWGGDVSFNNLDLRLEVLENELQLPFTFVSGHIHELLIHVPWTKITSEPITVTINTIECILKLKGPESITSGVPKDKKPKLKTEQVEAAPGYIQTVINKIVGNIRLNCNNLILKYVEDDIVLSMNIKLLKFESANNNWEPSYIDIPHGEVTLRKLISINDLTICLDKRNSSGKIEIYQEPVLYRCSMTVRLLRSYFSPTVKKTSLTRADIHCTSMEFSMNEQQVPMVKRIINLMIFLIRREYKQEQEIALEPSCMMSLEEHLENKVTWAGWAWSVMPSILPSNWEDEYKQEITLQGHTMHFGFYVDNASLTLKVSECCQDRGYYNQKKMKYWPIAHVNLQGVFYQFVHHGKQWSNSTFGISEVIVFPVGFCTCSQPDIIDPENINEFLRAGSQSGKHLQNSLFDEEVSDNVKEKQKYTISLDQHLNTKNVTNLLDVSPAYAFDFVHYIQLPDDVTVSDFNLIQNFMSFNETYLMRMVFGPLKLSMSSGFFHRLSTFMASVRAYDYQPYSRPKPMRLFHELQPPSEDDFEMFNERITMKLFEITVINPVIELGLLDHQHFEATKECYFRPRKRTSTTTYTSSNTKYLPKLTIECQSLTANFKAPLYETKLVSTTCQLPDPPAHMFSACHKEKDIKINGVCSRLVLGPKYTTIVTPTNAAYYTQTIIHPQYWLSDEIVHETVTFSSDTISLTGTNPKLTLALHILRKLLKPKDDYYDIYIRNSSLFEDASRDFSMTYLELNLESIKYKMIRTNMMRAFEIYIGSLKSFIYQPVDLSSQSSLNSNSRDDIYYSTRDIEQIMFLTSSEKETKIPTDFISIIIQFPLIPDQQSHPPVTIFTVEELKICFDPLFCKWLLYTPMITLQKTELEDSNLADTYNRKFKNISDISLMETPRKLVTPHESVHSSSDREHVVKPNVMPTNEEKTVDIQERIYNFLKKWFSVWKSLILFGEIHQCVIHFPIESLSAVGLKGMQETINQAVLSDKPPEIFVITLPKALIKCNSRKKIVLQHLNKYPIKLPEDIWHMDKYTFPWTISITDIRIYTLQYGKQLNVLKPTSISATVALSTNEQNASKERSGNNHAAEQNESYTSIDIETFGLCVYVDISPIHMYLSEVQIFLMASIFYGLTEVMFNKTSGGYHVKRKERTTDSLLGMSPVLFADPNIDTNSENEPSNHSNIEVAERETQKFTAWVQSTINKLSITILSHKQAKGIKVYKETPQIKLVFEAEDIVSSLDFQNVYLKIKSKIGSACIKHSVKTPGLRTFAKGPFLGIIMKAKESVQDQTQDDTCFANITITRANCKHTHNLWGTPKSKKKDKNSLISSRFLTEIVFTLQPIDFILPPSVLKEFLIVFQPLSQITSTLSKSKKKYEQKIKFNNTTLPLMYLEFKGFQFIFPTNKDTSIHDMAILQIESITVSPNPENPICRTPKRPDLYEKAAQARLLHIPGSELEDRQYQFDINKISFSTGNWKDLQELYENLMVGTPLKTMSENPAVEWNNLEDEAKTKHLHFRLWPFIEKFDLMIIAAPAMVYKNIIICNHSIEVNIVSDIDLNLCLSHFGLLKILTQELKSVCTIFESKEYVHREVILPYETYFYLPATIFEETASIDTRDSGFDADVKSVTSLRDYPASETARLHILQETDKVVRIVSKPILLSVAEQKVSMDVLITAGNISLIMSQLVTQNVPINDSQEQKLKSVSNLFDSITKLEPLLYMALSQPNCYLSDTDIGQKVQLSCFDTSVKISGQDLGLIDVLPTKKDFSVNILETRSGAPNSETGILPSLLTAKLSKGVTKLLTLDVQLTKPIKVLFSIERCERFITIYKKLFEELVEGMQETETHLDIHIPSEILPSNGRRLRFYDQYERFKEIKRLLFGLSYINVEVSQIVFAVKTTNDVELTMSIGELNHSINVNNRPERVTFVLKFNYITLGISHDTWKKLLLNPWSLSTELILFWEPWQDEDSDPQIQVAIESDTIMIDFSSQQIASIKVFLNEIREFTLRYFSGDIAITAPIKTCVNESNQYYKDDLRAGAFQFVDSQTNNHNELPLPYQVVFWNKNASIMAWRYPQPRVLTKVRVFPVPFRTTSREAPAVQILCHLEYWSDCYNCYQPYTKFYLSETEMTHLDLPVNEPKPIIACTWRVVLMSEITNEDNTKTYSNTRVPISPHVLAGCIRVDSYFSRTLVPDLIIVLNISSIILSFYNDIDKDNCSMPECLKEYNCDLALPENQCFLGFQFQNIKAYVSSWNLESMLLDLTTDISSTVLDYTFLTRQTLIEPFNARAQFSIANKVSFNFVSKPIRLRFGASTSHTLLVSTQLWNQKFHTDSDRTNELVIITPYVICNNCNMPLKFGQTCYEEIYLPTRYCHLYSWRSQKCKKMLRVAIEDDNFWVWSEPFRIDKKGTQMLKLIEKNITILVTVKALSSTQYKVTFCGQFCIYNMLLEHFEFTLVESLPDRDAAFKNAQRYILNGKSTPPTILLNNLRKYYLRIRFFGLDSAWSGDIPLQENSKSAQPWLVKVPLQERGQFLSIWCRMLVQQYPKGNKILAVLWPLFMIRSNLPVNSKIQIETPTLNVQLDSTINGKGEFQQLYCPGTIDHSHQITVQLDDNATTLNPYVPLNYSLVDQRLFFKRTDPCKIDEIIESIQNFDVSEWPYFGDDLSASDYVIGEQPLTHVQVKYQKACEHSSTLLVELIPWCLLLNTLGCQIGIMVNAKEICRVDHYGLVTPSELEETFHISVGLGQTWNVSLPLQLTYSDWSQAFYMPKITGTIPLEGFIKTIVKCGSYICSMLITSCVKQEIRLLKVSSTHIITNQLNKEIHIVCLAVPDTNTRYKVPDMLKNHSFVIEPDLDKKNIGMSIVQWYVIGNDADQIEQHTETALYVAISITPKNGWSSPVRVDKNLTRHSVCLLTQNLTPYPIVLTCTELDGQSILSVHQDNHPQLEITNNSGTKLFLAQCEKYEQRVVNDCEHFDWTCSVENNRKIFYTLPLYSKQFPEIVSHQHNHYICIASDPEGDPQGYQWSHPVNVTVTEQFVRIPYFGDVKVISESETHTIVFSIESISQTEINAHDIRVRLSQHEQDTVFTKSSAHSILNVGPDLHVIKLKESRSNTSVSSYCTAIEENLEVPAASILHTALFACDSDMLPRNLETESPMSLGAYVFATNFKVHVFLESVIFILTNDLENGGVERTEIASLTCDHVALKILGKDVSHVSLFVNEIQLDNQMYNTGSYDFSVILIGQEPRRNDEDEVSVHSSIQHLFEKVSTNPLLKLEITMEKFRNITLETKITSFKDVTFHIKPIALYIEDTYMMTLLDHLSKMMPNNLIIWPKVKETSIHLNESKVKISPAIMLVSSMLAHPIMLSSLTIQPVVLSLSVHSSKKLYVALDQSPLQFNKFERKLIITTPYRLGHTLTMHYLSGAIFRAGWVVGSLELLGSPGALARAMGTGLKDFVSMPCYGLIQGPWAFLKGITHGSASLMKHVTAGTLQSVTKLASSVARNLDRLTLDEEHLRRTEEQRRQKPQGVTQGFLQGLTGLGISLLGAIGGIAHHPLQSMVADGPSTANLISGVGLGIVGIFTKPLSGAADLVALTGQGLLQGAGWNTLPQPRANPTSIHIYSSQNTVLKYMWKYNFTNKIPQIIYATEATCFTNGEYESVAVLLMLDSLVIVSIDEDVPQRTLTLSELRCSNVSVDPTLITLKLKKVQPQESKLEVAENDDDDGVIVMDPASKARIAEYVKNTIGLLHLPEPLDDSNYDILDSSEQLLSFYVNPINRNYFISLLEICKQQKMNYNFPIY